MTPKEREAAARPDDAGNYRKPFDTYKAATLLWKDEVDRIDGAREKGNKSSIGDRTQLIRSWFKTLPKEKIEEAENAAAKWNSLGCPDGCKKFM